MIQLVNDSFAGGTCGLGEIGKLIRFTLKEQGQMCGRAVCSPLGTAGLVRANNAPREMELPSTTCNALLCLLAGVVE